MLENCAAFRETATEKRGTGNLVGAGSTPRRGEIP